MLVMLAVGGITCVVWGTMLWLSFLDEKRVGLLRRPVKHGKNAVRDVGGWEPDDRDIVRKRMKRRLC